VISIVKSPATGIGALLSPLCGFDGKASDMKIDGRCHCGYITYRAEVDLANVMIGHCSIAKLYGAQQSAQSHSAAKVPSSY